MRYICRKSPVNLAARNKIMDGYPDIDEDIELEDRLFPWLADGSMSDETVDPGFDHEDYDPYTDCDEDYDPDFSSK
jgi:hypothetical protein